jgi:hypothetical protein
MAPGWCREPPTCFAELSNAVWIRARHRSVGGIGLLRARRYQAYYVLPEHDVMVTSVRQAERGLEPLMRK